MGEPIAEAKAGGIDPGVSATGAMRLKDPTDPADPAVAEKGYHKKELLAELVAAAFAAEHR